MLNEEAIRRRVAELLTVRERAAKLQLPRGPVEEETGEHLQELLGLVMLAHQRADAAETLLIQLAAEVLGHKIEPAP
jgi:hypothetical protein